MTTRRERGTGTVRQRRPGVWEVRFSVNGEPESHTVHGTEKQAHKALRRFLVAVDDGTHVPRRRRREKALERSERTFRAAAERWLDMVGEDLSPTTLHTYRGYLRNRIYPAVGAMPLDEVTTEDLDDLYIGMRKQGRKPGSIRTVHAIVSRVFRMASKWGWEHQRPTENVTLPRNVTPDIIAPEPSDVRAFIDEADKDGNRELATAFFLAASIGARRGELCALRWSDVDLASGSLKVARNLILLEGGGLKEKDTKTHAIRPLALDPATVTVLRAHHAWMAQRAADGMVKLEPGGFVFSPSLTGDRPWNPDTLTRGFRLIRERLGLPKSLHFHSLRHFSATQLLAAGVDVKTVASRHGWADATMPLNRYGHFIPAADAKAAGVMGALLAPDAKAPLPVAAETTERGEG